MVGGFNDVVYKGSSINAVCFEDLPFLLVRELASLDVVGIVGEVHLHFVIDSAADFSLFLQQQNISQGAAFFHSVSLSSYEIHHSGVRSPSRTIRFAA